MKNLVITFELVPPFPYFIEKDDVRVAGPFATIEEAQKELTSLKRFTNWELIPPYAMKYSIKVTNIEGKIQLIKVLRTLEPGLALVEAKGLIWEEKIVDLSKIRRERHPLRNYADDFVFSREEFQFVTHELDDLVDFIVETRLLNPPSIEEAFRAGFEAGIATDDDVEEALSRFLAKCKTV